MPTPEAKSHVNCRKLRFHHPQTSPNLEYQRLRRAVLWKDMKLQLLLQCAQWSYFHEFKQLEGKSSVAGQATFGEGRKRTCCCVRRWRPIACSSAKSETSRSARSCTNGQSRSPRIISVTVTAVPHSSNISEALRTKFVTSMRIVFADKMSPERRRISCAEANKNTTWGRGGRVPDDPPCESPRMLPDNGKGLRDRMAFQRSRCNMDQCGSSVKISQITGDKGLEVRWESFLRPARPNKPKSPKREERVCIIVLWPAERISLMTCAKSASPDAWFRSAKADAFNNCMVQLVAGHSWIFGGVGKYNGATRADHVEETRQQSYRFEHLQNNL